MNGNGNGSGLKATVLGAVVLALATLFGVLNGVPWERKGAAAEVKADLQREIDTRLRTIENDVREVRDLLRGGRRPW